jgi:hypothetical protein
MPHQKGLLRKKREELELIAAISTQPDAELARLIEAGNMEVVAAHYKLIRDFADAMLLRTLEKCVGTLQRQETWGKLSDRPAEFNAFLAKMLKATERCLKLLHRIPDHRPTKEAERDQRLEALRKESPDDSWGQLANKYNTRFAKKGEGNRITPNIAERAVIRLLGRRSTQQREIILRALNAAESSLHTASLTKEEEILPLLPTPELILQLLLSDK